MQFRIPTWYLLALVFALLTGRGRAASIHLERLFIRDDGDDTDSDTDDSDSDSDNDGSHHHAAMAGRAHKLSKGAIAGIVIGCLLLFLLFLILCMCYYRRRRTRTQVKLANTAREAGFSTTPMKEVTSSPLLSQHTHSGSMVHSSPVVAAGAPYFSDRAVSRDPQVLRNLPPEASRETIETLPNPYDGDTPPQPPPRDDLSATSPTSPVSRHTSSSWYGDSTHSSNRRSTAPSAWTHDESGVPLLSRGTTHTSHRTTSSSLHDELSGYQKALEAHHRKESEDAAIREERIGEGSGIPVDPPPLYTASEGA